MSFKTSIYSYQLQFRQWLLARSYANPEGFRSGPLEAEPDKVLFVLAGLIGDSIMSLPAIDVCRKLWPAASITVLGKKHNHDLIAASGFFDDFYEFDADPFSLRRSEKTRTLETWLETKCFDAAIILLGDQFAHLLARANIPVRVGVEGTPLENCLTHTYNIGSPRTWGVNERLNSVRCLGYEVENTLPSLIVDPDARRSGQEKLRACGIDVARYIVLHPFGSTLRQWWSLKNIPMFATELREKYGLQVVLVGGTQNAGSLLQDATAVVAEMTGKLSLPELLAVIDGAKLVVTTDSGPFHIAAGLGKKTVGIFRSSRPEHATQYPSATVVFGENQACIDACGWDSCQRSPCLQMAEISVAAVIRAVADRLDRV